MKNITSSR